jgi:hypothetical protein
VIELRALLDKAARSFQAAETLLEAGSSEMMGDGDAEA